MNCKSQTPCSDLRSPLAKARDEFILSPLGEELTKGTSYGQYLKNRIERAWIEGAKWGQKNPND